MGRAPCCSKVGVQRGPWSSKEDVLLTTYIQAHGEGQWRSLPKRAGLLRCGKSCRLRWLNYLRPGIKRGNITPEEEDLIIRLQSLLGNRWSLISGRLPGRTDNEIKNHWNTHILKRLKEQGIEPKSRSHKHNSKPAREPERTSPEVATRERKLNKYNDSDDTEKEEKDEVTVVKVLYHPKPRRVSARFTVSSQSSVVSSGTDSLGSVGSSSQQQQQEVDKDAETNNLSNIPWSSFELGDDASCLHSQSIHHLRNFEDETLLVDYDLSLQDDTMLKKVFDEYLQLL